MSQNVPLDYADLAIEPFFDAIQELLSSSAPNFRLTLVNPTTVRVPAGTGVDQTSVAIDGLYRFRTVNVDVAVPGGAPGTYDVYVTTSDNDFTGTPPDVDLTDYSFGLAVRTPGSPPTGVDHYRKVGELEWDGVAVTQLRQHVGSEHAANPIRPTAQHAAHTPAVVRAAAGQTAPLWRAESSTGAALATIAANGTLNLASGAQLQIGGAQIAAANLSNGVTGSGSVVLATGPTLASPSAGLPAAPTAAVTDAPSTRIATTAYIANLAADSSMVPAGASGSGAAGTSSRWARSDHVHPRDTGVQPVSTALTNFAAIATTGFLVRTGANTYATRIVGGDNVTIGVTNWTGVAADPTIGILSTYVGQSSITTVGNITTGTWSGGAISISNPITGGNLTSTDFVSAVNGYRMSAPGVAPAYAAVQAAAQPVISNKLLAADANPAFRVLGDGRSGWGLGGGSAVDVELWRDSAGTLRTGGTIRADTDLFARNGAANIRLGNVGNSSEGGISVGADTSFYRSAPDRWFTPDSLGVGGDLIHTGSRASFFNVGSSGVTRPTGYGSNAGVGSRVPLVGSSSLSDVISTLSFVVADLRAMGLLGA